MRPLRDHVGNRPDACASRLQTFARRRAGLAAAVLAASLSVAAGPLGAAEKPDWDQVANIKDAAVRIAELQRRQGATPAFALIDACYKTHSLSSKYTAAFEACIAQDYLETQVLALVYSRIPPEALERAGAPTPEQLARSMGQRIAAAFRSYKIPVTQAEEFKRLVDEHGFPVFFKTLFPGAEVPKLKGAQPKPEQKKTP